MRTELTNRRTMCIEEDCFEFNLVESNGDDPELSFLSTCEDPEDVLEIARLEAPLLDDREYLLDHEVCHRACVSCPLNEATEALTCMRIDNPSTPNEEHSLTEACTEDVDTIQELLSDSRSVHETQDKKHETEEGESLFSLNCSIDYSKLPQEPLEYVNVEKCSSEADCIPSMEIASAEQIAKILPFLNMHHFILACSEGDLETVRYLLETDMNQEHKTDMMYIALMEASINGHVEVVRLLLDLGVPVNVLTGIPETPLTLTACTNHVNVAMLLIERGANIEGVNDKGYTPLMEAAREDNEEMVAFLLRQGANVNAQNEKTQETALTLACKGVCPEIVRLLIETGADIELGSFTPLMEAAREGHSGLVEYLLKSHANVDARTQTGDTALTLAYENADVVDLLLLHGAKSDFL